MRGICERRYGDLNQPTRLLTEKGGEVRCGNNKHETEEVITGRRLK